MKRRRWGGSKDLQFIKRRSMIQAALSLLPIERYPAFEERMATITKKELIDRIAVKTKYRRVEVKEIVQEFLDQVINDLGKGNRLEFRDFGVFETKVRKARKAQNPKTLEPVAVPEKRTVKFKVGRLMKQRLGNMTGAAIDDDAGDVMDMSDSGNGDGELSDDSE